MLKKFSHFFFFLALTSSSVCADGDEYENMTFENRDYARAIFQELYKGDIKNIKGIYRAHGVQRVYVDPLKACRKDQSDFITPEKQATFCKKFLSKEKNCPLKKDLFYVRYSYHERPDSLAPITGGFLASAPITEFADFKACKKNVLNNGSLSNSEVEEYSPDYKRWGPWRTKQPNYKSPYKRLFFEMGKLVEVPHYYEKTWNRHPDYVHLLDVKEEQLGDMTKIWLRYADIDQKKAAWFDVTDFVSKNDQKLGIEELKQNGYRGLLWIAALTKGDPFWIRFNSFNGKVMPKVYFAGQEMGVGEDKLLLGPYSKPLTHHDLRENGIHCFVKIEDGKLFFKKQIALERKYEKGRDDFSLKRMQEKNQGPDAIYYIDLTEYLKENEIRLIEFPVEYLRGLRHGEKCHENTVWMNKSPSGLIQVDTGVSSSFGQQDPILYDRDGD